MDGNMKDYTAEIRKLSKQLKEDEELDDIKTIFGDISIKDIEKIKD